MTARLQLGEQRLLASLAAQVAQQQERKAQVVSVCPAGQAGIRHIRQEAGIVIRLVLFACSGASRIGKEVAIAVLRQKETCSRKGVGGRGRHPQIRHEDGDGGVASWRHCMLARSCLQRLGAA